MQRKNLFAGNHSLTEKQIETHVNNHTADQMDLDEYGLYRTSESFRDARSVSITSEYCFPVIL